MFFSTMNYQLTYTAFDKSLKKLIAATKISGNVSRHSLRRGGTTSMRVAGVTYKGEGPLGL